MYKGNYTSVLAAISVELSAVELSVVEASDTRFWYSCARSGTGPALTSNSVVDNDSISMNNSMIWQSGSDRRGRSRCPAARDILKRQASTATFIAKQTAVPLVNTTRLVRADTCATYSRSVHKWQRKFSASGCARSVELRQVLWRYENLRQK